MQQGTIKFYNDQKGFGFITYPDGDIFFHIKQCEEGYLPEQDDAVAFEVVDGRDGRPSAINVSHVAQEEMAA
jgi:CspA family cold shock protein